MSTSRKIFICVLILLCELQAWNLGRIMGKHSADRYWQAGIKDVVIDCAQEPRHDPAVGKAPVQSTSELDKPKLLKLPICAFGQKHPCEPSRSGMCLFISNGLFYQGTCSHQ